MMTHETAVVLGVGLTIVFLVLLELWSRGETRRIEADFDEAIRKIDADYARVCEARTAYFDALRAYRDDKLSIAQVGAVYSDYQRVLKETGYDA